MLQGSFVNGTTTSDRQLSTGNYARAVTASIEGGYPVLLAPWPALEPQAQVIWQRLWINNAVDSISPIAFSQPEALTGRVGTLLRGTFGGPAAVWQPYLKGNVWFGGNGTDLVTFTTTPVPVQRNHGTALEGGGGRSEGSGRLAFWLRLTFVIGWPPTRRPNAKRFEIGHRGDYATLTSRHAATEPRSM